MAKRRESGASNPKPDFSTSTPISNTAPLSGLSLKHVLLYDWWLARAAGPSLAVSGFECRGRKLPRVFNSAEICKMNDATTLETIDGITVTLCGILNWSRTLQNGFPHEVCSHFLNGFPYYWESYATQLSPVKPAKSSTSTRISSGVGSNKNSPLPASLLNLHVTRTRDFVMFQHMDSEKLLDDMLEKLNTSEDFRVDEIVKPSDSGNKEQNDNLMSGEEKVNNGDLSDIQPNTSTSNVGVTTRSMTRLKNLTQKTIVTRRSMTRLKKTRKG